MRSADTNDRPSATLAARRDLNTPEFRGASDHAYELLLNSTLPTISTPALSRQRIADTLDAILLELEWGDSHLEIEESGRPASPTDSGVHVEQNYKASLASTKRRLRPRHSGVQQHAPSPTVISPCLQFRCICGNSYKSKAWFNRHVKRCGYIVGLNANDEVSCEQAGPPPGVVDFHVHQCDQAGLYAEEPSHTEIYNSAPYPLSNYLLVKGSGDTTSMGMDRFIPHSVWQNSQCCSELECAIALQPHRAMYTAPADMNSSLTANPQFDAMEARSNTATQASLWPEGSLEDCRTFQDSTRTTWGFEGEESAGSVWEPVHWHVRDRELITPPPFDRANEILGSAAAYIGWLLPVEQWWRTLTDQVGIH